MFDTVQKGTSRQACSRHQPNSNQGRFLLFISIVVEFLYKGIKQEKKRHDHE